MSYSIPTPPSSNEDSPRSLQYPTSPNLVYPLGDNNFLVNQAEFLISDTLMAQNITTSPSLHFIEEPVDKFRFRYKSEMAGTHGSLTGKSYDKSRKPTYPTVELRNCSTPAKIRCSIYQCDVKDNEIRPHAHKLIMKKGKEEFEDPHEIAVSKETDFRAIFHSMGIIHTAKKFVYDELLKKKMKLFKERVAQNEYQNRSLTNDEIEEIKEQASNESKTINLNIACLRFDAFIYQNGIPQPICPPLYSNAINNLKSALTGELKIVRMDHCTSPSKGGREIFLLVERVTKKNIKVRFFEVDENDEEIWEAYGKFSDLDVHHQYAIVFKTPPYHNININGQVKVNIELVRPSDNAKSEPKEFTYIPTNDYRPGMKRARNFYSYDSSDLDSDELPTTLNSFKLTDKELIQEFNMNSDELERAIQLADSEEFNKLLNVIESDNSLHKDSPLKDPDRVVAQCGDEIISPPRIYSEIKVEPTRIQNIPIKNVQTLTKPRIMNLKPNEYYEASEVLKELLKFMKTNPTMNRCIGLLKEYFSADNKTNALHVFIAERDVNSAQILIKFMQRCNQTHLLNIRNSFKETPLILAIINYNEEILNELLAIKSVDVTIPDGNYNTPLHLAIKCRAPMKFFQMLLAKPNVKDYIDATNADGYTPLVLAILEENSQFVSILCRHNANVNYKDPKNGYTPLRYAIKGNNVSIVEYLLEQKDLNPFIVDFNQTTIFQAAQDEANAEIFKVVNDYMIENEIKMEIKEEVPELMSEEEMETEEIKVEPHILEDLYANVDNFTNECLTEVAKLLDESGNWEDLANLLDLTHCLKSGIISSSGSISQNIITYAVKYNDDTVLQIRNFLEIMGENKAVQLIDNMVKNYN